jgi:hypothetical protein
VDKWQKRFELIRGFGWLALAGTVPAVIAFLSSGNARLWTGGVAVLCIIPVVVYTYVVILWHWKDRYRGTHSDL